MRPLEPAEVDTVVVAGVGGRTAVGILHPDRLSDLAINRVVVQPNRDDVSVRAHVVQIGWRIVEEVLVYDGGRFFLHLDGRTRTVAAARPVGPMVGTATAPAIWAARRRV